MTAPRVLPRRGEGLATSRPGLLLVPTTGRPLWVALEDAHTLADELVDAAEAMEDRHTAAQESPHP